MAKGLGQDERYWECLSEGRLELPKCMKCGHWQWPAPYRCNRCGSWEFDWVPQEIAGILYSWTRVYHSFDGTEGLGSPYVPVLVEIPKAGGIRLLGLLDKESQPRIGKRLSGRVETSSVFGREIPAIRWTEVGA
jgi:uncharacterized OB-fold protein